MSRAAQLGLGLLAVVVVVLVIFFFNPVTGFLMRQVEAARADEETAIDANVGLNETLEGQAHVEAAAGEVRIIVEQARGAAHAVEIEARAAPGGDAALPDSTVARLRQSDNILCGLRPGSCTGSGDGASASADDPG
jgi:uncharacterized iron-regulated membrane protein